MEPGQGYRVPTICLDPFSWSPRYQGRRDDTALLPEIGKLAIQSIAGWPCLITEMQFVISSGQLGHETPHSVRRVFYVAKEADFSLTAFLGQSHRDFQFGGIKTHKSAAILIHNRSSCSRLGAGPPASRREKLGRATAAWATNIR